MKNGYRIRNFLGLPIGRKRTIIRMKIQRYKCKECDYDQQENISFATGSRSYTHRFAKYVVDLLKMATLKDVANLLSVSWDMAGRDAVIQDGGCAPAYIEVVAESARLRGKELCLGLHVRIVRLGGGSRIDQRKGGVIRQCRGDG